MVKLDCSQLGIIMTIIRSSKETKGKFLEMEWQVLPGAGGKPLHKHPFVDEIFQIRTGQLQIFTQGHWITARAGDIVTIPKGDPHTFKNLTGEPVYLSHVHTPAMGLEDYYRGLCKFAQSGLIQNKIMTFKSVLGLATLWNNYPVEIRSVNPPNFLMKFFALIGRIAGMNFK